MKKVGKYKKLEKKGKKRGLHVENNDFKFDIIMTVIVFFVLLQNDPNYFCFRYKRVQKLEKFKIFLKSENTPRIHGF